MKFKVALYSSEEGFSVSVPGLPGCWSQGETEKEALLNIEDAIREYLAVAIELVRGAEVREVDVAV
ncbi:MAG TPA: type II toxin-antitoxin system HicB family antitoxin [Thermoanaerobaculia bacterium]|nr:type II toxin-antitoxin system HicB family antitoxin [Thermoanaerobaculia bacterium]